MNSESQSLVPATQQAESEESTVDEVRESLSTTEKGQPANTIGNCRTVFCQDPLLRGAIRLNLLTDRVDIVRDLGWRRSTSALTDTDVKYLLLYFEQNYGLTSEKKLMAALSIVANENCYHPIQDVLNSLIWDGIPRIRSCLHHFLGCDLERVYQELEERFPKITFIRCYMDPIMQKHGPTPDQKLRKAIYEPLPKRKADEKAVSFLGSDFVLEKNADLKRIVRAHQEIFRELPGCKSWEDYLALSEGKLFISSYPPSKYGAEALSERLKRPYLYLPGSFDYEEITAQLENFCQAMGYGKLAETISVEEEIAACEKALEKAHEVIGDTAVAIDYLYHPRPLGLAKLLLTHGFRVIRIYLDSISPEEKAEFEWLKEHAPDLQLIATIQVKMRVLPRTSDEKILAIGQKAAWFTGSPYFVNMVQGGGLYGFDGIRRTAELMAEAFTEEKDTEDLVVRKGWGCESCI